MSRVRVLSFYGVSWQIFLKVADKCRPFLVVVV